MHSVRVRKRLGLELYEMLSRGGLGSGWKKKIGEWARVCRVDELTGVWKKVKRRWFKEASPL